jgi:hypothetical protein
MAMTAAIVSQSAAAAAVLRLAEGAVDATPSWYPAAAVVGAVASVLLPMAALHVAWVWGDAVFFIRAVHSIRLRSGGAAMFRPGGLRRRCGSTGTAGEWAVSPLLGQEAVGARARRPLIVRVMLDAVGGSLYGDYRGGRGYPMLVVAQFIAASQALQGVAQAAGEFASRDGDDGGAHWSCVIAAWSQLAALAICTGVLRWMRPQRSRSNYYAELLPTVTQLGLCVLVVVLAARHWSPNEVVAARVAEALDVTGLLQPVLSVLLSVIDASSE